MIKILKVNQKNMAVSLEGDFSTANELADYLTKKGLPFKEAHKIGGEIVLYCIKNEKI